MKQLLAIICVLVCGTVALGQGRPIVKDATDQTTYIRIIDSTDGTPETGVTSGTAGIDLEYVRLGAAPTDLTESDLAATDSAHSDGGIKHVGGGNYRVDLPDAAVATGVNEVIVQGTVTGMIVIPTRHALINFDIYDADPTVDATKVSGDSTAADNLELAYDGTGYQDDDNHNGPRTWYVNTSTGSNSNSGLIRSAPLETFAQAQTNASTGDIIEFLNNASTTAITISKALTVRGPVNGRYHTVTVSSGNAITISTHNVTLENMAGTSTDSSGTAAGLRIYGYNEVTARECKFESEDLGIYAYDCDNIVLDRVISRCVGTSGAANDRSTDGTFLEGGANWRLTDCQFRTHSDGAARRNAVIFYGAMHGIVENCRFEVIKTAASSVAATCVYLSADDATLSPIYELGISTAQVEPPFLTMRNNLFYAETTTGDTGTIVGIEDYRGTGSPPNACPDGVSVFLDGGNKWLFNTEVGNSTKKIKTQTDAQIVVASGNVTAAQCDTSGGGTIDILHRNLADVLDDTGTTGVQIPNGEIVAATFGAGAIDAAAIATAAIGNAEFDVSETLTASASDTLQTTTIATLASQTSFTLTAGSADNDAYNDAWAVITDASTTTQKASAPIADYVGSTRTVTLEYDPAIFTMAAGDTIAIMQSTNPRIAPFLVAPDHTWRFDRANQVLAPNLINESTSGNVLVQMDFTKVLSDNAVLDSISSVTVTDESGKTEPTIVKTQLSADKQKVLITTNTASASTLSTGYTYNVTIVTSDNQTITRKGKVTIQ